MRSLKETGLSIYGVSACLAGMVNTEYYFAVSNTFSKNNF